MSSNLVPCMFGLECYRKNPTHFKEYSHPPEVLARLNPSNESESPDVIFIESPKVKMEQEDVSFIIEDCASTSTKRPRLSSESNNSPKSKANAIGKFGFYLTKVEGISSQYNSTSIGIKDILSESKGKLIRSAQFNYVFDLQWLTENYPSSWRKCPLDVIFGNKQDNAMLKDLQEQSTPYLQVNLIPTLVAAYGTHHTKMMLLQFEQGLQVVVHTSNMIASDWGQKTQGVWISPIFPLLNPSSKDTCPTNFKADLLEYLKAYKSSPLENWCSIIQKYDFSSANVFLIASVPGSHQDNKRSSFGHLKLRKYLSGSYGPKEEAFEWPIVCQFSSIGSLGPEANSWLNTQFLSSMSHAKSSITGETCGVKPELLCIYPTVENVRSSLEGYMAGGSLPYRYFVAEKQKYLNNMLYQWKATSTGRDRASPHIKTYCRLSPDCSQIAWFLLTSANLSKAAWGSLTKTGINILSYEMGVLFLPKFLCGTDSFKIKPTDTGDNCFTLPFDTPLIGYSARDRPWICDMSYMKPDALFNVWTPNVQ